MKFVRKRSCSTVSLFNVCLAAVVVWSLYGTYLLSIRQRCDCFSSSQSSTAKSKSLLNNNTQAKKLNETHFVSSNKSQEKDFPVTAFGNRYLIQNPDICKRDKNLKFLVVVHTAISHWDRRNLLRSTWANAELFQGSNHPFRVAFFLGESQNAKDQITIEEENTKFGDIVQGKFLDTYRNLTNKAVLWLRWVSEHCSQVEYVLKVDDDVVVNVFTLFKITNNIKRNDRKLICDANLKGPVLRKGKWKTNEFPDWKFYPRYCKGYFVILPSDLIPKLFQASKETVFFWIDDVYFSGFLTQKIANVAIEAVRDPSLRPVRVMDCFVKNKSCRNVATIGNTDIQLETMWSIIVHQEKESVSKYLNISLLSKWLSKPKPVFPV